MKRVLFAIGIGLVLPATPARAADREFAYIDLQPKANQKLKENLHSAATSCVARSSSPG